VVAIITDKINQGEEIAIVVSARGNATDELEQILTLLRKWKLQTTFEEFKTYQQDVYEAVDLSEEFIILEKLFEGVSLIIKK
jgi:aspartokinase/homoserine dehydrogenase 1